MKFLMLWFFICFVFGFYSLNTLVEDSYEVVYEKKKEKEQIQFLFCVKLNWFYPDEKEIDLKELRKVLFRKFNSSDETGYKKLLKKFKEPILKLTKSGDYLILDEMVCLIANGRDELIGICAFLSLEAVFFAIRRDTFDLVRMGTLFDKINKLTVLAKEPPYSDCDKSNAQFRCLNECFKSRFRLAKYLYHGNETGLVQLTYSHTNQTIKDHEKNCFGECKRANCKMSQLILLGISTDVFGKSKNETFEARPKLAEFDYWLQLIGLVCSFAGLSLHELTATAIEFAASKVKRRKLRIALVCLKWVVLLIGLAFFGYLCARRLLSLKADDDSPLEVEKSRSIVKAKIVHLAICVDIRKYINIRYEKKTMMEIERATDGALSDALENIQVNYWERSFDTNYMVHPKVLLKDSQRCFLLSIRPKHQMIASNPKLAIKFKEKVGSEIYFLSENENLNGKSFRCFDDHAFMKRVVKRSGGRCVDYREKYGNCTGRWNCVERCTSRKFMERYNQTTFGTLDDPLVIDQDWFSLTEWNTSRLTRIIGLNVNTYKAIRKKCMEEIADKKPCFEIKFINTVEIRQPDRRTKKIDLQFEVVYSVQTSPSAYKLVLDLVNLQSILFGLTVFSSLKMTAFIVQTRLSLKKNKAILFVIYLLSSVGASWHTYHILHLVTSGKLVPSEYYKLAKEVQMPVMMFCDRIDQGLIDRNHKLTGDYLEELTRESTTERMFSNIAYLNESNEWAPFVLSQVERLFFLDMKCFRIQIDQAYQRNQFHFSTERQILKVKFAEKSSEKKKIVYFLTQTKETLEFSKVIYLNYLWIYPREFTFKYSITYERSFQKYEDRFRFIRRYFTSIKEDDVSDLNGQLLELQRNEHNLRTLNLPVEEAELELEVDEDLFEQLYLSQRKRRTFSNQLVSVANHLRGGLSESDLIFNLNFLQKIVYSTNEANLGKITLSLLNVLFIWFDLGVLDLHPLFVYLCLPVYLFGEISKVMLLGRKRLKKIKLQLYKLFGHRKQTSL